MRSNPNNWPSNVGSPLLLLLVTSIALLAFPAGAQVEVDQAEVATDAAVQGPEVLQPSEAVDTEVAQPSGDIDEMVVLASGRDDFLKDMSVSVTSFSAAELKSLRIQNIADLADYTPNLEINTRSAASNPTLFIRGIGLKDYNANAAGAVAVYQDGVNINSPAIQLGQLFDTESISVLRGPQGSLNGRNATAGAIMINSVLPTGDVDRSISLSYGNFNSVELEGAVSFPLIEDLLSSRVAFTANFRDGTTKNHCANWDPESVGLPLLSEETVRAAWELNGRPNHLKNSVNGTYLGQAHTKNHNGLVNNEDFHFHVKGTPPRFPNPTLAQDIAGQHDAQDRRLANDGICIWDEAGHLNFDPVTGEETWFAKTGNTALTPSNFQGLKRKVNNIDNWAARTILRFQPDVGDNMDWILNLHGGQNLGDTRRLQSLGTEFRLNEGDPFFLEWAPQPSELTAVRNSGFEKIRTVDGLSPVRTTQPGVEGGRGGADVDAGFYDFDGLERLDMWGASLRGLWDTGSYNLTSLTGYEQYRRRIADEGDATSSRIALAFYDDQAWQVSQELRVTADREVYRWSLGGFMLYEELEAGNLFPGLQSRRIEQRFEQELLSLAVYGSGRYWVLDEVYLDAGLRYNREQKEFTLASTIIAAGSGQVNAIPADTVNKTWTGVTGEATIAWEPASDWMYDARLDHLNIYAKYGRGMKGGHFNAGLTIQSNVRQVQTIGVVEPEFLHSLEFGFKSRWFQDLVSVNFAFFRYWYQDLQVFDFSNERGELPIQKLLNSDAQVTGAEIEIQARPIPGLMLQFGGGWLNSKFLDFKVSKAILQPRGQGDVDEFDYSGHPLISAPKWSFSGVTEYSIPLMTWGTLVPQYNFNWRSKVYLDPQKFDPISQEAYWQHNARLAYRTPDGRIEVAAWVENIVNKRYKIDVFDLSLAQNQILEVWNDPRMFGVTVSAYF